MDKNDYIANIMNESFSIDEPIPQWRSQGGRYYSLADYFRNRFGGRVRKISIDARFSCPNVDGTVGTEGCIFCNNASFAPSRRPPSVDDPSPRGESSGEVPRHATITEQIDEGIRRVSARYPADGFIAYFQPATNTYAPKERLAEIFTEAVRHPKIWGLAIGTRPDALPDEVLDWLADLARSTWLSLEIGLQSSHNSSLEFLRRGHDFACFADAVARANLRNLRIGTHIILGIPGEDPESVCATAKTIAAMNLHSVKLHHLHVVRDTPLAEMWLAQTERAETQLAERLPAGEMRPTRPLLLPTLDEYANLVVDFLERLPPTTVIERLAGDAPRNWLLAPDWSSDKNGVRRAIESAMTARDTFQGKYFIVPHSFQRKCF